MRVETLRIKKSLAALLLKLLKRHAKRKKQGVCFSTDLNYMFDADSTLQVDCPTPPCHEQHPFADSPPRYRRMGY